MNYQIIFNSSYLAHHGILGQKWGQRNGPPYPIDPSGHSVSEKKAGYTKSINKKRKYSSGELKQIRKETEENLEKQKMSNSEYSRLYKENERLVNEVDELTAKYDLDGDDGGGGDTDRFSDEELQEASRKWWELNEKIDKNNHKMTTISKQYRNTGERYIEEKYGQKALKQIKARDALKNTAMGLGVAIAIPASFALVPVALVVGGIALAGSAAYSSVASKLESKRERKDKTTKTSQDLKDIKAKNDKLRETYDPAYRNLKKHNARGDI